ncbi:MAG TPA: serine hydrolase [Ferruginibacter sp.]|nr:serine hydrolase [Ferruginibacter sp.]
MKKLLLCAFTALSLAAAAQTDSLPSFIKDSLDIYVNRALQEWKIPGVAVCVVKNGKIALMKGYGVKEMNGSDPVDENTLFMIGSNTKAFTATAMAMLEADKKLTLDDKVQKWLPAFTMYDPWVGKEAMLRDLLCHRLGFETFQGDFMYFDSDLTAKEVMEKMGKLKPKYGFRSKWGYTNSAFAVAGAVIQKASGSSWDQYLTEKIFRPLGMDRTLALSAGINQATNKAAAHTVVMGELQKIPYGNIDNMAPAGSIASSANDMSKWVTALLANGKWDGKQVIPAAAIAQTRTPHSILGNGGHPFNKAHFALYGLGWFLEEYAGRKIVAHTGGVNGFVTSVCLVPEEKLGIIVLTNTDANNFYEALRNEIEDACLGLPYRNYSRLYLQRHRANEQEEAKAYKKIRDSIDLHPQSALPLSAYAGEYKHDVYGSMTMTVENNKLIMRFQHHHGRYGTLEALGGNHFYCTYSDPIYGRKKLSFTVAGNKVQSIGVEVADFIEFGSYDFKKVK